MPESFHPWLPYQDDKPVGAADFYFGINATFRFIRNRCGEAALLRYWEELGTRYMQPVAELWNRHGLDGVAHYWRDFFAAEPHAEVTVTNEGSRVVLEVHTCPAIKHLREHGREIEPTFCRHCFFVSDAAGKGAGVTVRVEGGAGSCRQTFIPLTAVTEPQDLSAITLVETEAGL